MILTKNSTLWEQIEIDHFNQKKPKHTITLFFFIHRYKNFKTKPNKIMKLTNPIKEQQRIFFLFMITIVERKLSFQNQHFGTRTSSAMTGTIYKISCTR